MLIVFTASLICLLLTYLDVSGRRKNGLAWGFALITIIQCIRYDYGTDYMNYYWGFYDFVSSNYTLHDVFFEELRRNNEYGWSFILWLFSFTGKYGFFIMNIVLGVVENLIFYFFIKNKINRQYWIFAVFVFLFTSSFYLLGLTMLRQWLAIALFVLAFGYIEDKKIVPSLVIVFIASTIHRSAVLLFPFAFLGYLPFKRKSVYGFVFLSLFVLLSFSGETLNTLLELFMGVESVEDYMNSYGENESGTSRGLGFILNLIPFIVAIYYLFTNNSENRRDKLLVILSCIGTMMIPFAGKLQMVQRLSLYFLIFTIAAVPITYNHISNKMIRLGLVSIFVLMHFYGYFLFFKDPSYIEKYTVYHTIFSAL